MTMLRVSPPSALLRGTQRILLCAAVFSATLVMGSSSAGSSSVAQAQVGVRLTDAGDSPPRVDGMLRDWRGVRRAAVGEGNDASFHYVIAYDAEHLYLNASIRDERVVRAANRPSRTDDALVISWVSANGRRGLRLQEFWIYPGVSGRAATVAVGGARGALRPLANARAVERQVRGGVDVEAAIPLSALGARWADGRLAIRYNDVDLESRPTVENAPASAEVVRGALDRLPRVMVDGGAAAAGSTSGPLRAFMRQQGMAGVEPDAVLRGDVAGDAQPETVARVGRWLVVFGPGYRDGQSYDSWQLPVRDGARVRSFALRDITGDGKEELVVSLRQEFDGGSRDLWRAIRFDGEQIAPIASIETRRENSFGSVEARLQIRRGRRGRRGRGSAPVIEVRIGEVQRGIAASSMRVLAEDDVEALLVPWGPVAMRRYRWDGTRLAVIGERPNRVFAEERPAAARAPDEGPSAPGLTEIQRAAMAALSIPPGTRPDHRARANVAEDRTVESVMMFGNTLVVFGVGFRGGDGYFSYAIPASDGQVQGMQAVDLTGDGRAEILLRVAMQAGDVEREFLVIHRFARGGRFPRVLMAEVARRQGPRAIENRVRAARELVIAPGRARGWNAQSWPWGADASSGFAPLLLPWRDSPRRYRFDGTRFL